MINLAIPANMDTTLKHLSRSGYGITLENESIGYTVNKSAKVVTLRSLDIPLMLTDSFDLAVCGEDVLSEQSQDFHLKYIKLAEFHYGREFGTEPTLDLIASNYTNLDSPKNLEPGSIVFTEHISTAAHYLENYGVRSTIMGRNPNAPVNFQDFKKWCRKEYRVGITTVHGRIPALVLATGEYGIMVNETGETLKKNPIQRIETVKPIHTVLVANPNSLENSAIEAEIRVIKTALDEGYQSINQELEFNRFKERLWK